jgi:hypothetical protein
VSLAIARDSFLPPHEGRGVHALKRVPPCSAYGIGCSAFTVRASDLGRYCQRSHNAPLPSDRPRPYRASLKVGRYSWSAALAGYYVKKTKECPSFIRTLRHSGQQSVPTMSPYGFANRRRRGSNYPDDPGEGDKFVVSLNDLSASESAGALDKITDQLMQSGLDQEISTAPHSGELSGLRVPPP